MFSGVIVRFHGDFWNDGDVVAEPDVGLLQAVIVYEVDLNVLVTQRGCIDESTVRTSRLGRRRVVAFADVLPCLRGERTHGQYETEEKSHGRRIVASHRLRPPPNSRLLEIRESSKPNNAGERRSQKLGLSAPPLLGNCGNFSAH